VRELRHKEKAIIRRLGSRDFTEAATDS
jgi:hypothetical protein